MTSPLAFLSVTRLAAAGLDSKLRSRDDKLAFALHAYVLTQGYKLVATGTAAEAAQTDFSSDMPEVDATGWDALPEAYSFRYQDTDGRRPALHVKCIVNGAQLLLHWDAARTQASPEVLSLETQRFTTDASSIPAAYQNTDELLSMLDDTLGKTLRVTTSASVPQAKQTAASRVREDSEEAAWESGFQGQPSGRPSQRERLPPGIPATGVGYEDVVPPGARPPGGIVPGRAFPGGLEGLPHGGGGMHVGPGHPMFGPGKLGEGVGQQSGGHGRGGLPPGARWDPIGPPGTQGFRPDDFQKKDPSRPDPDIMQPGPGRGTDWDAYFG